MSDERLTFANQGADLNSFGNGVHLKELRDLQQLGAL